MIQLKDKVFTCPVDVTLSFIGGKWKLLILSHLFQFKKRSFSEIRDNLPGISEKMLAQQLKELSQDQFIAKKVLSLKPLRVEYFLTDQGNSFAPIYSFASEWGIQYLKKNGIDYLKDQELFK
jgi:DNA-binding HxlR family transcriptional regulator